MAKKPLLREIGEYGMHQRIQAILGDAPPDVLVGIGDDAAVFLPQNRPLVITADAMVEGIHFRRSWTSAADLAYKSLASNISDLAAKGAEPAFGLVAIGLPRDTPIEWIEEFYQMLANLRNEWGLAIIGGDTVQSPQILVSITVLGYQVSPKPIRIHTAQQGHRILVTGTVGDAAAGLEIVERGDHSHDDPIHDDPIHAFLVQRFRRPQPRLHQALHILQQMQPSSMTDISDGLARDLPKVCQASGVGAYIKSGLLPQSAELQRYTDHAADYAWRGGEDYELLLTLPPDQAEKLLKDWDHSDCRLTQIGEIRPLREGIQVDGCRDAHLAGFDHFRSPSS